MKTWILSITATGILTAIITAVSPKTSGSNTVRLCCGIVLVLCVFSPIKKLLTKGFDWKDVSVNVLNVSEQEVLEQNEVFKGEIIQQHLTAYILKRTKQLGIDCEVRVGVGKDDEGHAFPENILIVCEDEDQEKVREIIRNECGIEPMFRAKGKK
ncbi:MAG: hypothetical protein E7471_00185 [Ruminococcaceae bacterium]|nr:hypothetical protein [Oscillospiraceae bacterium]